MSISFLFDVINQIQQLVEQLRKKLSDSDMNHRLAQKELEDSWRILKHKCEVIDQVELKLHAKEQVYYSGWKSLSSYINFIFREYKFSLLGIIYIL